MELWKENLNLENFEFKDLTPNCTKGKRPKVLEAVVLGHKIKLLNISRDDYKWLLICHGILEKEVVCSEVDLDLLKKEIFEIITAP